MILGYPRSDMVLGLKGKRSRLGLELTYSNMAWVQTLWVPSSFVRLFLCERDYSKSCGWMFIKFLGRVGLGRRNNQLDTGGDLHSDLDPWILFLLHLFVTCIKLHYFTTGVSIIMLMILVMSLISILCTSLTLRLKTHSLMDVSTLRAFSSIWLVLPYRETNCVLPC